MNNQPKIAILYFSRSAHVEASNKNWDNSSTYLQRALIATLLNKRTLKVLNSLSLDVFQINENQQIGDTFGERLANAYQDIYDQGYESVISVGNDCIELHKVDWDTLILNLTIGKTCVGPDQRNGVYLIGCTKKQFDKKTFEQLPWQTKNLISEVLETFTDSEVLPRLADFNEKKDLHILLSVHTTDLKFVMLLISIFKNTLLERNTNYSNVLVQLRLPKPKSLRAPPYLKIAS